MSSSVSPPGCASTRGDGQWRRTRRVRPLDPGRPGRWADRPGPLAPADGNADRRRSWAPPRPGGTRHGPSPRFGRAARTRGHHRAVRPGRHRPRVVAALGALPADGPVLAEAVSTARRLDGELVLL